MLDFNHRPKLHELIGVFIDAALLLRPHEVSSGGIFDAGILKVAHHPLG